MDERVDELFDFADNASERIDELESKIEELTERIERLESIVGKFTELYNDNIELYHELLRKNNLY